MKSLNLFNSKKVLLILLVFSFMGLVNAQKKSSVSSDTKDGLRTTTFKTKNGDIKVYLPSNLHAGDVISGTVIAEPKGKNKKQVNKNKNILNGYVIELAGKKTPIKKGKEKWILPDKMETEILPLELKSPKGKTLGKASVPAKTETRPLSLPDLLSEIDFNIPSYFRDSEPTVISGVFDGDFLNSAIQINNIDANILAESPEGLFFEVPVDIPGPVNLKLTEGDYTIEKQTNILDLNLSADKLNLIKGEATRIQIEVSGLQGIGSVSVPIEIKNLTPASINMEGGNNQRFEIPAEEINEDGIFVKYLNVRAARAGGFSVMVNIETPESVFIKLISPVGRIYDSPASQPITFEWKTFGRADNYTLQIWQLPDNFMDSMNYDLSQGLYVDNFLDPLPVNIKELTESEPYFMKEGIEGTTFIYPNDFDLVEMKQKLSGGKCYGWKITAFSNKQIIGHSKICNFSYINQPIQQKISLCKLGKIKKLPYKVEWESNIPGKQIFSLLVWKIPEEIVNKPNSKKLINNYTKWEYPDYCFDNISQSSFILEENNIQLSEGRWGFQVIQYNEPKSNDIKGSRNCPEGQREYYVQLERVVVKERPTALSKNSGELCQGASVCCTIEDLSDVSGYIKITWRGGSGFISPNALGTELRSGEIDSSEVELADPPSTAGAKG